MFAMDIRGKRKLYLRYTASIAASHRESEGFSLMDSLER